MQFYRLFTHKTNTQDIKSNCFICIVPSFPQRLFTVHPVLQIHHGQVVPAANPYLRCTSAQGRAVNAQAGPHMLVLIPRAILYQILLSRVTINRTVHD